MAAWLSPESLSPVLRQKALQLRAKSRFPVTRRIIWKLSTNGIVEIAKAARVSAAAACVAWRQVPRAQLSYLLVVLGHDLTTPWSHRPRGQAIATPIWNPLGFAQG
jgi:hypothetical protein